MSEKRTIQDTYAKEIACVLTITLVVTPDYSRNVQVQVAGNVSELITALRMAGQAHAAIRTGILGAASLLDEKKP